MEKRRSLQVVLVEGERPARILLQRPLSPGGKMGVAVQEGDDPAELLCGNDYDLVTLALEVPGGEGGPLRMLRGSSQEAEVVLLMDQEGEEPGEEPWQGEEGGYDFLTQPVSPAEIQRLVAEGPRRPGGAATASILGSSPALLQLLVTLERVAASSASVLIQGETGTGKSLVARALHELSPRRAKPFVAVNCSAFQEQLLESELFGHERGAFTGAVAAKPGLFEVAHGGTLFLDEVAEMSPAMQAKLLQVLDEGELRRVGGTKLRKVDVRAISASNKSIDAEVEAKRFRRDLLFRLKVVTLEVPPLRQRREDIPELVAHFLGRHRHQGGEVKAMAPAALRMLSEYAWPGNVRELANVVEGLVLMAPGPVIGSRDLPAHIRPASDFELESPQAPLPMAEVERLHIIEALRYTEGKKAPAARLLGIDVKTLSNKIKSYGIEL